MKRFGCSLRIGLALLAVAAWPCRMAVAQSPVGRTVLTVHWSTEDFPSTALVDAAIRQTLLSDADAPIDYFAEYLESDRFPSEDASLAFRDYIRRKYSGRHVDVVIAVSDPSLEYVLKHRAALFPDTPIVASIAVMPDMRTRTAGAGLTGVAGGVAYDKTLELALRLHPSTTRVFVVAHAPTLRFGDRVQEELQAFSKRVEITYLGQPSMERILPAIRAVPAGSLVLYVRHSQEDRGNVLLPSDVARLVSEASPVPVYGVSDSYMGSGVVGGVVSSRERLGARLGQMARQLLSGTRAQDIPMEPVALAATFDWRQLQRWGIDPALLPPGSDIRFRAFTIWEQYRGYVLGAAALMLLQTVLIGALLFQGHRRRRVEAALRESEAHFRETHAELSRVSRLTALGEFAASIAHEVRQPLTAIMINASGSLRELDRGKVDIPELRAGLIDIVDASQRADEVIERNRELFRHHTVQALPLNINKVILEAIVLASSRVKDGHITLTTALADNLPTVSGDRIELEQVLLNLIGNAIDAMERTQSAKRRIHIASSLGGEQSVKVALSDTGVGLADVDVQRMFTLSYTTKATGTGVGLSISRSIVEAHGGRLWAEDNPQGGAIFSFTLPASI
jgi:signal transduction histidine kinase